MARAGAVSRDRMRAYGYGLRRVAPQTIPSIHRSEEKANWPLVLAGASGRRTLSPRPGARRLRVKVLGRLGAGTGALLLDGVEGGEDPAVAGTAAQVAGDGLTQRQLVGVGPTVQQVVHGHDHPGDAEAALDSALLHEGPLHIGQLALGAQPFDRADLAADRVGGQDAAGGDQDTVQHERAGAALALLAGILGTGQAEAFAQHVQQALADPGAFDLPAAPVDGERVVLQGLDDRRALLGRELVAPAPDVGGRRVVQGVAGLAGHARLLCSARVVITCTARRRYSAVLRWSVMGLAAAAASSPKRVTAPAAACGPSQSISPEMNASASVARTGVGATEPSPHRTLRPSRSTTRAAQAIEITMALRVPTLRNCWEPRNRGTRTSRMISPCARAVRFTPVTNSAMGKVRF